MMRSFSESYSRDRLQYKESSLKVRARHLGLPCPLHATAVHLAILHVHARNLTYVELSKALCLGSLPSYPDSNLLLFLSKVPLDRSHIIHFWPPELTSWLRHSSLTGRLYKLGLQCTLKELIPVADLPYARGKEPACQCRKNKRHKFSFWEMP